jgi:endonuclease YncB( thermonuclease family)
MLCAQRVVMAATLLLVSALAAAESFSGKVVNVSDGDTITVLDSENKRIRVRINGIDAPEKGRKPVPGQPYADKSRQHMLDLAKGKAALVTWHKQDRYGRFIGRVDVDGVDVGLEQLRAGLAWVYREYLGEVAPADRPTYLAAERQAQEARAGLWGEGKPVPPWEWRKAVREARDAGKEPMVPPESKEDQ